MNFSNRDFETVEDLGTPWLSSKFELECSADDGTRTRNRSVINQVL